MSATHCRRVLDLACVSPTRRRDLPFDDAQTRRALRRGDLLVLRRGVFVGRHVWERAGEADKHILLTRAAILATQGAPAYAGLGSAALVHGFDRLGRTPQRVRLYRSRGRPWRDDQIAVLTCGLPQTHVGAWRDVRCTSPARTVVDLSRWVSFRGGVVVADSALRLGVARDEMQRVALACARWPGIRKAKQVIAFADPRAATPLESVSRVVFHELGVPPAELQVALAWSDSGEPRYIVDFFWPEFGVVGEADGMLKYDDDPEGLSLRREKLRQEELEDLGYLVVRWTWDDIWRRPDWVAARLQRAFRAGPRRRPA